MSVKVSQRRKPKNFPKAREPKLLQRLLFSERSLRPTVSAPQSPRIMEKKVGENEPSCSSQQEAGDDCDRSPDILSSLSCHLKSFTSATYQVRDISKFVHLTLR